MHRKVNDDMENVNEIRDDEIEIDLKELIGVLWRKAWIIILAALVFGAGAFAYTTFLVTPLYQSSSMIYILSSSTSVTSLTDIQLSSALTEDYEVLALSRPVIEEVIDVLDLDYSYEELCTFVTVTNPTDSHVLKFTIEHYDAQLAMEIANEMADVVSQRVANVMATDTPSSVESAVVATEPSSPNTMMNTLIGILLGLVLSVGIIVVVYVLDDTIKDEDDVVKYLGKNVFATLPKESGKRKEKKQKKNKTSHHSSKSEIPVKSTVSKQVKGQSNSRSQVKSSATQK